MNTKMTKLGVGPIFALLSIIYASIIYVVCPSNLTITHTHYYLLIIISIPFILFGTIFYIISVNLVMKAYNNKELVTHGPYKYCRHPAYSSWSLFIVPGFILLLNNWLTLTIPIFMNIILLFLVQKEEKWLETTFNTYIAYKKRTPKLLPKFWK
jgi:protein-S-isoprenylcysteine O-methyltransferase Ste14